MTGDIYLINGLPLIILEESLELDTVLYIISHQVGKEISSYVTYLDSISRFNLLTKNFPKV